MYSRKLYTKIIGSISLIVLFSLLGAWLFITEWSYTFSFGCLIVILLITLFVIRLINDTNRRVSVFFESLRNRDSSQHYPENADDPYLRDLYGEMNRVTGLFSASRTEVEEKRLYFESILRVLTHEIRNSITPISSLSADLLKHLESCSQEQLQERLEVINSQARSLTMFLNSYHRLTHLPDPERQTLDLQELFTKLSHLLCAEAESDRIRYQAENGLSVQADPNLIVLALINLIRNALQAIVNQPDGSIIVRAFTSDNKRTCITVTDNGPGISPELLSAIFTPFFSTKSGGSGIGLPISQRIMQLHNGQLTVASVPNARTIFTLVFE